MKLPFLQVTDGMNGINISSTISSIGSIDTIGICPIDDHQTVGIQQQFNIIQQQIATNINNMF